MTGRTKALSLLLLTLPPGAPNAGEVSLKYLCEDVKKPFFSFRELPGGGREASPARELSVPSSFRLPKPPGVFRLFIVGESAASILAAGDDQGRLLSAAFGAVETETINCGMGAYESSRILSVLREVLDYEPDMVAVLSGNNESGRNEICPGLAPELARRSRRLRSRFEGLSLSAAEADARVSLAIHEERLREMAREAKARGVPIIFCTLPANLRDLAPSGQPPARVAEGIAILSAGRPEEALRLFEEKGLLNNAFARFYAGRALQVLGRHREAAASYGLAVSYDEAGDRCSPDRNAMIRRVAAEEGACLADLEGAFSAVAPEGIIGGGELADGVHWFGRYNRMVYGAIAGAASSCLKASAAHTPQAAPRPGQRPEDFGLVLSYAAANFAGHMRSPACSDPVNERLVTTLERLCALDCNRLIRAVASPVLLKKELRRGKWDPSLPEEAAGWHYAIAANAAEMLERAGRADDAKKVRASAPPAPPKGDCPGISAWKAAPKERPLQPGERPAGEKEAKTLSDKAVKLISAGRLYEAKELLARAAALYPEGAEVRLNACHLAAKAVDPAFGSEHCDQAIELLAAPPPHALPLAGGLASAYYARAYFRLAAGLAGACGDLRAAAQNGGAGWPFAAEAASKLQQHCR